MPYVDIDMYKDIDEMVHVVENEFVDNSEVFKDNIES